MLDINALKFDEKGLIPAIVVDADTDKVLTLAYMNEESLKISMEKGLTCFYSRSRQELWLKGETSKNYQHIVSITADCDNDALVVRVRKDGPACHTGTDSCFTKLLFEGDEADGFKLQTLYELLIDRKTKVIIAGKADDKAETVYEIADLAYHLMVLMVEMGITVEDVRNELASRHVIDHKVKQEKMV